MNFDDYTKDELISVLRYIQEQAPSGRIDDYTMDELIREVALRLQHTNGEQFLSVGTRAMVDDVLAEASTKYDTNGAIRAAALRGAKREIDARADKWSTQRAKLERASRRSAWIGRALVGVSIVAVIVIALDLFVWRP